MAKTHLSQEDIHPRLTGEIKALKGKLAEAEQEIINKNREIPRAYYKGLLAGVWRYAWSKDGVMQVGSCGTPYADAKAKIGEEVKLSGLTLADLEER